MNASKQKSGAIWPRMIFVGYGVFAATLIGFAVFTSGHRMDLVTQDYYGQEHVYQDNVAAVARTQRLTPPPEMTIDAAGRKLLLSVKDGAWEGAVPATLKWYRPSNASLDREEPVEDFGPGERVIDLAHLPAGYWKVGLHWQLEGHSHLLESEVILP